MRALTLERVRREGDALMQAVSLEYYQAHAGLKPTAATRERWGLAVGTGMQGMSWPELSSLGLAAGDGEDVDPAKLVASDTGRDPLVFCRAQSTAGLALLGRRYGIHGYATSVHTACASGGQAIGTALKLIRRGTVDFALAGGFDSMVNPVGLAGFCLLGAVFLVQYAAGSRMTQGAHHRHGAGGVDHVNRFTPIRRRNFDRCVPFARRRPADEQRNF